MKITIQTPENKSLSSIVMEPENDAERYQVASITRSLEMGKIHFQRWSNEEGRGITIAIREA